jgi:hypothetical protein
MRPLLSGQWYGHYQYGEEYAPKLVGEKVKFSFLLEDLSDNHFRGKCIEIDGIGASTEISLVQGCLEGVNISFTKEYPQHYFIDEDGKDLKMPDDVCVNLIYKGIYHPRLQSFSGTWELWKNEKDEDVGTFIDVFSGKWVMSRKPNI